MDFGLNKFSRTIKTTAVKTAVGCLLIFAFASIAPAQQYFKKWTTAVVLDAQETEKMREQLSQISEASTLALQETRQIARNLHPAQIENLGLTAALRSLVKSVESATGLQCEADIEEVSPNLAYDASINIYRITQESLSNIIKHSSASCAAVRLRMEDEKLVLTIEDDGRGFTDGTVVNGLGLTGMRERARMINADLTIDSQPGQGTKIRLTL